MVSPTEWFDLFHGSSWIQEAMAEAASPLKSEARMADHYFYYTLLAGPDSSGGEIVSSK